MITALISTFIFVYPVKAAENNFAGVAPTSPYVVTIEKVSLKNGAGRWVKIISPDRRVDLAREEAAVTFFNNAGRVPKDGYVNFLIEYLDPQGALKKITAKKDFDKNLAVKKGSFIHVSFDLNVTKEISLSKVSVTSDEDKRELPKEDLSWL